MQERPDFPYGGWMLYSTYTKRRHEGSAGGVVTELTRFLLEKSEVQTALGFTYETSSASYTPKWVYSAAEVMSVGSIYHEIPLIKFLRHSLDEIRPPLLVIALPCQVGAVRAVCKKAGIPVYVVALVCSGQLRIEATRELFRRVTGGRPVAQYRYRGGGWPSGVRIECGDGQDIYVANQNSIWSDIFHSTAFNLPRCFSCRDTFGIGADMTVGDPWLPRYVQNETEGVSMCIPQTRWAVSILRQMLEQGLLELKEIIPSWEVSASQRGTLEKKAIYRAYPTMILILRSLYRQSWYMKWVFERNLRTHIRFHRKCMNLFKRL
jgi:coenzyme F420-reducing hydrogenase beta subunit